MAVVLRHWSEDCHIRAPEQRPGDTAFRGLRRRGCEQFTRQGRQGSGGSSAPAACRPELLVGRRKALAGTQGAAYSAAIDEDVPTPKEPAMKTSQTTRLASLAFAMLVTLPTLAGIDHLAQLDDTAPLLAQATTARA